MWKWSVPPMNKKVHGCEQAQFTGILKYYKVLQFIHNNRTKTRKERFMEILSTNT